MRLGHYHPFLESSLLNDKDAIGGHESTVALVELRDYRIYSSKKSRESIILSKVTTQLIMRR